MSQKNDFWPKNPNKSTEKPRGNILAKMKNHVPLVSKKKNPDLATSFSSNQNSLHQFPSIPLSSPFCIKEIPPWSRQWRVFLFFFIRRNMFLKKNDKWRWMTFFRKLLYSKYYTTYLHGGADLIEKFNFMPLPRV